MSQKYLLKYILIGDFGVGKSSLLFQLTGKPLNVSYYGTIGVDFSNRIIHIDKSEVKLQIWRQVRQDSLDSVNSSYYLDLAGALLVYDITRRSTFERLQSLVERTLVEKTPKIAIIIIGNKNDLEENRQVKKEEGTEFARKHGFIFIETSFKNASNLEEAFINTAKRIHLERTNRLINTNKCKGKVTFRSPQKCQNYRSLL